MRMLRMSEEQGKEMIADLERRKVGVKVHALDMSAPKAPVQGKTRRANIPVLSRMSLDEVRSRQRKRPKR